MSWNRLPFIIVIVSSILPWVAAYMNAKWVTYIPIFLSLSAYLMFSSQNVSNSLRISYGFLFVFSVTLLSVSWQLINGLGIGSGGLIIIFTLTFVFFSFFRSSHDGIPAQYLIKQISIIYAIHIIFIFSELALRLFGLTDLLVSIAGNATEVMKYKTYNKAMFLRYIGFMDMTGLNSLLLGSQSASQLTLFSLIWYAPFYKYNPLYKKNRLSSLWFILSSAAFLVSITMMASILLAMFLLLFIYVIPLSNMNRRKYKVVFPLFVIMFSSSIFQLVFFNITDKAGYLVYFTTFMESIEQYILFSPVEKLFGFGSKAVSLINSADFGLGMLLLQVGILLLGLATFSLIAIFIHVHRSVARLIKSSSHHTPWAWLATVNSLIALGWGASLVHYTPAVELGGRELFAFHLAACLFAFKKLKLHYALEKSARVCQMSS